MSLLALLPHDPFLLYYTSPRYHTADFMGFLKSQLCVDFKSGCPKVLSVMNAA